MADAVGPSGAIEKHSSVAQVREAAHLPGSAIGSEPAFADRALEAAFAKAGGHEWTPLLSLCWSRDIPRVRRAGAVWIQALIYAGKGEYERAKNILGTIRDDRESRAQLSATELGLILILKAIVAGGNGSEDRNLKEVSSLADLLDRGGWDPALREIAECAVTGECEPHELIARLQDWFEGAALGERP